MSENFRNKQWFKNLSQERKDEICDKFDIDEKTLRKAGRETVDGRIVVDLLRIDHISYIPELWDTCYNIYKKNNIFNESLNYESLNINDMILYISKLYCFINSEPERKLFKYKSSLKNDLFVKDAFKYITHWIDEAKYDLTNKDYVRFCCYQIYTHCRCLLESDLNIVR